MKIYYCYYFWPFQASTRCSNFIHLTSISLLREVLIYINLIKQLLLETPVTYTVF